MARPKKDEQRRKKQKEVWSKWWEKNGQDVLEKRKLRYQSDVAYRERAKLFSRVRWDKKEYDRVRGRLSKIRLSKRKMQEELTSGKVRRLNPRIVDVEGERVTVYPMLFLSVALGAEKHSVKRWTQLGVLPRPSYIDSQNRYWYTKEYINSLEGIYEKIRSKYWKLTEFREALRKELPDAKWD